MKLKLRPYQERGLRDIREQFAAAIRAVLYVLPTGGGKTVTYAAIAEGAVARGKRVLILEHRKELVRQASLALGGIGVPHQVIMPPKKVAAIRRAHIESLGWPMIDYGAQVAVASVQTLASNMDWLAEFDPDLIVIDEAHHAVAGTWARIIAACPRARILGVTATPCRTNGQGLGDVFKVMVLGPSMKELIEAGYLVPFRVVAPPLRVDLSKIKRRGADLDNDAQAEILMACREITGDAIEHYNQLAPGRPAIVFAANLKHAEVVATEFRKAGWRFEVIHGGMPDGERDALIKGLSDGTIHGLVNKDLISEGTDIPAAEVCIMLRLTDSESWYLQAGGRVGRPVYAPGYDLSTQDGRLAAIAASPKPFGLIIDHVGNSGRIVEGKFIPKHGLPHDVRDWDLNGRKKRAKSANEVDETVLIRQCPECYAIHSPQEAIAAGRAAAIKAKTNPADAAPQCPSCEFTYSIRSLAPPKYVAGKLVEVSDDMHADAISRSEARRAQAAAKTVPELAATGMSTKRAQHIVAARQEKARLQQQLKDLISVWHQTAGRPKPAAQACEIAFGFPSTQVMRMKPKQLSESIELVTEEILRLQLGAPVNDGSFALRSSS